MIGLDTNVLVRYILNDDPVWSPAAARLLETELSPERPGYVNVIVLAELVWALRRARGFDRSGLVALVEGLLESDSLVIEKADAVARALRRFKQGPAGFPDYLIAELNVEAGASPTVTIDKAAAESDLFRVLAA